MYDSSQVDFSDSDVSVDDVDDESVDVDDEAEDEEVDHIEKSNNEYDPFTQGSIRGNSPFNKIFQDIFIKVSKQLSSESSDGEPNSFYCPDLIDHLLKHYMPYSFLWSGFVLRDTGLTRLTNGALETYNGTRKRKVTKNRLPHHYLTKNFTTFQGHTMEYLNNLAKSKKNNANESNKRKQLEKDLPNFEEKKMYDENENWAKGRSSLLITCQKSCGMGYQRNVDLETIELNHAKRVKKLAKHSDLDAHLLKQKEWLNNFVIESFVSSLIDPNTMFLINSEISKQIFVDHKVDFLSEVSASKLIIYFKMKFKIEFSTLD